MKNYILALLCCIFYTGCQSDENVAANDKGYLRLIVGEEQSTNSRIVSDYNPKQLAIQILNSNGKVVKSTDNWENWRNTQLELNEGTYTIKASSNGFDGSESGWEIPYYVGSQSVTIERNKEVTANITCSLANVKVTATCTSELLTALKEGTIRIEVGAIDNTKCSSRIFSEDDARGAAYFPVTDLYTKITVTSRSGKINTLRKELRGVKARDHYQLRLALSEAGNGKFTVKVNEENNEFTYNFIVSTKPTTSASISSNAWSNFAYLKANNITMASGETIDAEKVKFEYKETTSTNWISLAATATETGYSAKVTNLKSGTQYDYQLNYNDGEFISNGSFTTEEQMQLPNSNFEDWCVQSAQTALSNRDTTFPCNSDDYTNGKLFWDTSNRGANSIGQKDPTKSTTEAYSGKHAAVLSTITVANLIAAASLYTGEFQSAAITGSATLDFGRPFKVRPTQLTGYYKYIPKSITKGSKDTISGMNNGDRDHCSIYILLADWDAPFRVDTGNNIFIDIENDQHIIAYGELSQTEACPTVDMDTYQKFTINLEYRDLTRIPNYIVVVCSASKYGDYFTGGNGSTLYLDDFELIYGDNPQTK